MDTNAIKELLYRFADDELIIGHRVSEWTGIGPVLEEDIAFSSMAQDEVGHAQAYYFILHELLDEPHPDHLGFNRKALEMRCCKFVEQPIGDYAFSLVRHVLYDYAETIRLRSLTGSAFRPLAELAKKLIREEKYHLLHAETWMKQLGSATEESNTRLQTALDAAYPMAFSIFEPTAMNDQLKADGIQEKEQDLEAEWIAQISELLTASGLKIPEISDKTAFYGGRKGEHSEYLEPLLKEMTEVYTIEPMAKW